MELPLWPLHKAYAVRAERAEILLVDEGVSCAEFTAIIGGDPIDFASVFVFHFYTQNPLLDQSVCCSVSAAPRTRD
jgi:hypothetical protein